MSHKYDSLHVYENECVVCLCVFARLHACVFVWCAHHSNTCMSFNSALCISYMRGMLSGECCCFMCFMCLLTDRLSSVSGQVCLFVKFFAPFVSLTEQVEVWTPQSETRKLLTRIRRRRRRFCLIFFFSSVWRWLSEATILSDNNDGKDDVHDHDHDTHSARFAGSQWIIKIDRVYCMFAAHSRTSLFLLVFVK